VSKKGSEERHRQGGCRSLAGVHRPEPSSRKAFVVLENEPFTEGGVVKMKRGLSRLYS